MILYPTFSEVDEADEMQLLAWWKDLPLPQTTKERFILDKIKLRLENSSK